MGCVVEFDEFHDAYGRVDDNVAGFGHAAVNYYGDQYQTYDVSLPLWQYRYKILSKVFCVSKFAYEGEDPRIDAINDDGGGWAVARFDRSGTAHAVVFWVDYLCRSNHGSHRHAKHNDSFRVISTASATHRQAIRKLTNPIVVTESDVESGTKFCCKASFGTDPDVIEDHSFSFKVVF